MAVVVVVRSDLDRFIIPDAASGCIAGLGLVYALAEPLWEGFAPADALAEAVVAVLAGCGGFAALWLVGRLYRLASGHQGLGFGDVKLAGASAMWLTPADAVLALETAALAGLAVLLWRRRGAGDPDMALPFGAFLAPAAWLAFVVGPTLHRTLGHLG